MVKRPSAFLAIAVRVAAIVAGIVAVWVLWMQDRGQPNSASRPIASAQSAPVSPPDSIPFAPLQEEFFSADQRYRLVLSTSDRWQSKRSIAAFFDGNTMLWSKTLPHEYRPRYARVSSHGNVVLLDEWINVKSRFAVMVLDRSGQVVAQHDLDRVQQLLKVPMAEIVEKAKMGWWISEPPTIDGISDQVYVETGGKRLAIQLKTGELTVK